MPTCCWYSESTCCPANNTGLSALLNNLADIQDTFYQNVTDGGQNTSEQLNYCLSFYENAVCALCDPSGPVIMPVDGLSGVPVLVMCESFCDQWFDACDGVSQIASRFDAHNITTGTELCMFFPQAITMSGGAAIFNISVESTDCYRGAEQDAILNSTCLPWYEEPNAPTPPANNTPPSPPSPVNGTSELSSELSSDGNGGDDDGGSGLYWLFFLLAAVVLVLLVVVVVVVAFVLWKRRQAAAAVTTDSNAYPDLDELDDYE